MANAVSAFLHYLRIAKSLLRVPTFMLLVLYLLVGFLTGLLVEKSAHSPSINPMDILQLIVCAAVIAAWYITGSGLNDYVDYEIDRINLKGDKERPLIVGTATKPELINTVIICAVLALAGAAILSYQHVLLVSPLLLLAIVYSLPPIQISRRGGLAPLLLPFGYIILPFYLGFMLHSNDYFNSTTALLVCSYYLHFMGRIILKDYRDVRGDKAHGKLTFLLRHGNTAVCISSGILIIISTLGMLYALREHTGISSYAFIFFLCFGLTLLYQLAHTAHWRDQKPLLAAFGRVMTGVTSITIVVLFQALWPFSNSVQILLVITIIGVYAWSAQQAFLYNKARMR